MRFGSIGLTRGMKLFLRLLALLDWLERSRDLFFFCLPFIVFRNSFVFSITIKRTIGHFIVFQLLSRSAQNRIRWLFHSG